MKYLLLLAIIISSCEQEASQKNARVSSSQEANNSSDQSKAPSEPSESNKISGQEFFLQTVVPVFNLCQRCHAAETIPVERDRGPISIFEYEPMLKMLNENKLLPMIRGTLEGRAHPVNDPCLAGLNSSPCKEVVRWWDHEFGDDPSKASERPLIDYGQIVSISSSGLVTGWALNPRALTETVTVRLMVEGNLIAQVEANLDTFDADAPGPHGFEYSLPPNLKDGQRRQLIAQIIIDETLDLEGSPYSFASVPQNPLGKEFFDQNVNRLILANCGCHGNSLDYEFAWEKLVNPIPTEGGSATNNRLYLKAAGQTNHAGGNACSNNGTCDAITQWWQQEFGSL